MAQPLALTDKPRPTMKSAFIFSFTVVIFAGCLTSVLSDIQDHGHGHAHGDYEPPAHKYSQAANEAAAAAGDHGHAHDHGHGHAHDHGHGHAHDHGHGHAHDHGHGHAHGDKSPDFKEPPAPKVAGSKMWLWLKALSATAIISIAPVFILLVVPLENANEHQDLLKVLLSFASGGLLGDAFLHLIPHAISPHDHHGEEGHEHSHGHSHGSAEGHDHGHGMGVGLWVLGGIIAFLIVEKFVRYVKGGEGHGHSHGHSNAAAPKKSEPKKEVQKKDKISDDEDDDVSSPKTRRGTPYNLRKRPSREDQGLVRRGLHDADEEEEVSTRDLRRRREAGGDAKPSEPAAPEPSSSGAAAEPEADIKVAGYLNLAADFAHNFTDGLAIGASFLAGQNVGIITTITIFLHEIPHEIGDFAILIQSGCSKKRAMMLQFSTALGAMAGTVCSLLMEGISATATAWILPFTAGGFIYIATVSVIPELLEDSKIWQSVKEIAALLVGVYMMVVIAWFE